MQIDKRFTSPNAAADALEFIRASLEGLGLETREAGRAQLMAEESLVRLLEHGDSEKGSRQEPRRTGAVQVSIRRFPGRVTIKLTVPGRKFDFAKSLASGAPLDLDEKEMSPDAAEAIQNLLLRSFEDRLRYRHRRGCNHILVTAVRSPLAPLYWTLGALFLAVLTGLLLKGFASPALCDTLNEKVLVPLRTVFMNGLKLCAVPVVFFSIASCVARFGDLSEVRRIGTRLLLCFVAMQCIAAGVGIGVFALFPRSGHVVEIAPHTVSQGASITGAEFSVTDTLVNLMPSNIIRPFLERDMLQLIVLAVFIGVAVGALEAKTLRDFLEESSGVFMKIMDVLMRFVPLAVFCSIASMFLTTGFPVLFSLLDLLAMVLAGDAVLAAAFCLITAFWCRLNPARLLSKSLPMIVTAFSTSSSVAAFPDSMRVAERLGIPPKVRSLSIPLGASVNQNGTCVFVVTASLFLAKVHGLDVPPSLMFSMAFSVVALTMGAASVPGFGLVALSMLMSRSGGPVEAVGLVMSIFPVFDMFGTVINCMGDMTATLAMAARSGMLDREAYNKI